MTPNPQPVPRIVREADLDLTGLSREAAFVQIPSIVLADKKLNDQAKVVYAWLLARSYTGDSTFVTRETMALDLGKSLSAIKRALKQLAERGLIAGGPNNRSSVKRINPVEDVYGFAAPRLVGTMMLGDRSEGDLQTLRSENLGLANRNADVQRLIEKKTGRSKAKDKRVPTPVETVRQSFEGAIKKNFGADALTWNKRDQALAKRLLEELGPSVVEKGIERVCERWDSYKKRFKREGLPDIGVLYNFRSDVFGEVQLEESKQKNWDNQPDFF